MAKVALITGILGQDGSYLTELLLQKKYILVGFDRRNQNSIPNYFQKIFPRVKFVKGQLTDESKIFNLIKKYQPDEIYNLAAISSIKEAWDNPLLTSDVDALGPQRIYEAVKLFKPTCRIFQALSSEIFGKVSTSPQDENTALNPTNPYGHAKAYAHQLAKMYREKYKLFICCGILYNHESPRRGLNFVTQKIAYGAACAKMGIKNSKDINEEGEPIVKNGKVALGNLDAQRDWSFAADFTRAMWLMLGQEKPDDYVLGSGQTHTIAQFCEVAFSFLRLDYKNYVVIDPRFVRPIEPVSLKANPAKAIKELKWTPKVKFEKLVRMMVNDNLKRLI